jgi:hypothetical protein
LGGYGDDRGEEEEEEEEECRGWTSGTQDRKGRKMGGVDGDGNGAREKKKRRIEKGKERERVMVGGGKKRDKGKGKEVWPGCAWGQAVYPVGYQPVTIEDVADGEGTQRYGYVGGVEEEW